MNMEVINMQNRKELDKFILSLSPNCSLQSWDWGEFLRKAGAEIARFAVKHQGSICAAATLVKRKLPLGKAYFYIPRGPIIDERHADKDREYIFEFLIDALERYAIRERAIFIRIEPGFLPNSHLTLAKTIDVQPSRTAILDISKPEEEILKSMHQKTRYNIRLSGKKGVEVAEAKPDKFSIFWKLMTETGQRDKFRLHSKEYYHKMIKIGGSKKDRARMQIKLYLASYKGAAIAANIVSFFGDTAVYMHGCSSNKHRSVMAPYALQWHCIKEARERGCSFYDLFGVDEKKWPGVTRFKNGFGADPQEYPGTYDAIINLAYYRLYKMARKARRSF